MSTLAADYTLLEQAKRIDPDGTQATIAEIMAKEVSLVLDMPFLPSNDIWSHKSLRRANLPSGTWRGLNEYVSGKKSQVDEILDVVSICEVFAAYDIEYINNMPNPKQARLDEATAFIEGLAQDLCSAFLYSNNKTYPKKPHGIAPRLDALGRYVVDATGTSALTSIYVVGWDKMGVFAVYPKNSEAPGSENGYPIIHTDLGERVDVNSAGNKLRVYEDNFKIKGGFVVRDPRYLGRVANVPSGTADAVSFENNLITLCDRMKISTGTKIYMNETVISACRIRMKDKNNVHWVPGKGTGLFGEPVMYFDEIPIRKIDSAILLNSESAVA